MIIYFMDQKKENINEIYYSFSHNQTSDIYSLYFYVIFSLKNNV